MSGSGVWILRHPPVDAAGICYGQCDVPTLDDPRASADDVLARLASLDTIDRVWTSPWRRTRELAEAMAAKLGVPLHVDPRLSELSFGTWEGRAFAEIEACDGERFARWMADWRNAAPPGGEPLSALLARVGDWRREVLEGSARGVAVSHAGVVRALRAISRGTDYGDVVGEAVVPLALEPVARLVQPVQPLLRG